MSKKPDTATALAGILRAKRGEEAPAPDAAAEIAPADAIIPLPPSPAPVETARPRSKKKADTTTGKRANPDYCQANAYVPKSLRRAVDKALIDIEGMDYSDLIADLLNKWLKSRRIAE